MGRNARQHPSRRSGPLSMRAIVLGGVLVSCVEAAAATALLYFYGGGTDRDLDLPWRSSRVVVLLSARVPARKARPINVAEVMDSRMSQNPLVWRLETGHVHHTYLFPGPPSCGAIHGADPRALAQLH